jgi:hypothetical protein
MTDYEIYALQCFGCRSEIEIRCDSPCVCPVCEAGLDLQWGIRFVPAGSGSSGTNRVGADNFMKPIPVKPNRGIFRGRRGDPSQAPRCGAKTRRGTPCQRAKERNPHTGHLKKCRLHGGLSSGPKTMEGRARIAAANWRHGQRSKAAKEARRVLREKLAALKAKTKGKR